MNRQIQHYLESYPVEERISIVRRESCEQGHEEKRRKQHTKRRSAPRRNVTNRRTSIASRRTTHLSVASRRTRRDWCLLEKLVRSFKTAVAHYPSTSVATHNATTTTHLHCVTTNRRTSIASRRIDAPPLRHNKTKRNGVPHLDGTTKRRTSVASRRSVRTN